MGDYADPVKPYVNKRNFWRLDPAMAQYTDFFFSKVKVRTDIGYIDSVF
jgi:hypothetical protein